MMQSQSETLKSLLLWTISHSRTLYYTCQCVVATMTVRVEAFIPLVITKEF